MRKLVLYLLMLSVCQGLIIAQTDNPSGYLKGAVPEINGKVVFSKTFEAPYLSSAQLFDQMLKWAKARETKRNYSDSIVYVNRNEGLIVLTGIDTLVFSEKFYMTDESSLSYKLAIVCIGTNVEMTIEDLYYEYIVSYMDKPETYYAEELITDKAALKSKGKKLIKKKGKFRKFTIDYINELYQSVDEQLLTSGSVKTNNTADPLHKEYTTLEILPEPMYSVLSECDVMLFVDNNDQERVPVIWQGIDSSTGEKIIKFTFDAKDTPIKDNYRLAFFQKGDTGNKPWLIIDCTVNVNLEKEDKIEAIANISGVWMRK